MRVRGLQNLHLFLPQAEYPVYPQSPSAASSWLQCVFRDERPKTSVSSVRQSLFVSVDGRRPLVRKDLTGDTGLFMGRLLSRVGMGIWG